MSIFSLQCQKIFSSHRCSYPDKLCWFYVISWRIAVQVAS